jgi:hypothetical protein
MDPVPASQAPAGQISADGQFRWDGQQWVPLPASYREPTPWTRPMQLASAGLQALSAISGVVLTSAFVNHDSVLRALQAQGTQVPAGTDINTLIDISIGVTWAVVIGFGLLQVLAAIGSYLGWRWMFWGALVLFALGGLGAIVNLLSLASSNRSTLPAGALIWNELVALANLAMFIWMLIGVVKYGPWAMKRPGR